MPDALKPGATLDDHEPFGPISWWAILFGAVTVVAMCFHANYELHVTGSSVMTLSNFPICSLIWFMVWVIINAVLRAAAPRYALKPMSLLTIMVMTWAAGMTCARGWGGKIAAVVCSWQQYASPENRWVEIMGDLVPKWTITDLESQAGNWFYQGLPRGVTHIPWSAWAAPFFWWGTAGAAAIAVCIAIAVIFHRQWVTYERLNFPLASVPMTLVSVRKGDRVAPIFRKRLFWVGVALAGGVLCWNIVGYFVTGWFKIKLYTFSYQTAKELVPGFPKLPFRIQPTVIGFMYLANLDLLFSLWFLGLLGWIEVGMADSVGFTVGSVGKKLSGRQILLTHNYGAILFLALWSVWVARKHLRTVCRAAVGRDRSADNPGGAMSYRTALVVLVLGLVYLGFFGHRLGMSLAVVIPAIFVILVAFFVTAKYMAATGMPFVSTPGFGNGDLMVSITGNSWMSPQSMVGLGLMHGQAFGGGQRVFGLGMLPHALKVGEQAPKGRSRILLAVILALAVGSVFSTWHTAKLGYVRAGLRMDNWTIKNSPQNEWKYIASQVEDIQQHKAFSMDLAKFASVGVGFVGAFVLTFLHGRVGWWPLHPVGLAFSASHVGRTYWLSIFIVWLSKLVILKIGGARLYERVKPLFIGLVVGYVLGLILSYATDAIFFFGQYGHVVHDW